MGEKVYAVTICVIVSVILFVIAIMLFGLHSDKKPEEYDEDSKKEKYIDLTVEMAICLCMFVISQMLKIAVEVIMG